MIAPPASNSVVVFNTEHAVEAETVSDSSANPPSIRIRPEPCVLIRSEIFVSSPLDKI